MSTVYFIFLSKLHPWQNVREVKNKKDLGELRGSNHVNIYIARRTAKRIEAR